MHTETKMEIWPERRGWKSERRASAPRSAENDIRDIASNPLSSDNKKYTQIQKILGNKGRALRARNSQPIRTKRQTATSEQKQKQQLKPLHYLLLRVI